MNVWLNPPADYLLFIIIALAAVAATLYWVREHAATAHSRLGSLGLWAAVGLILAGGWFFVRYLGETTRDKIGATLQVLAPLYADEMSRHGHAKITLATPADDPLYLQLISLQKRWMALNPLVHDIYTMRKLPDGRKVIIVDAETDYDRDGKFSGEREQRTPIGEVYPEADPGLELALAGRANFESQPVTDRWGTWIGAAAPIYREDGSIDGVLGLDYDASLMAHSVALARLAGMVCLAVFLVIVIAAFSVILLQQARLSERIRADAEKERLIAELQQSLAEVKTLHGLLPICANCKKVRDDQGYWAQIDLYLAEHTNARFTHGICPDCVKKLYPEYADSVSNEPNPAENPPKT